MITHIDKLNAEGIVLDPNNPQDFFIAMIHELYDKAEAETILHDIQERIAHAVRVDEGRTDHSLDQAAMKTRQAYQRWIVQRLFLARKKTKKEDLCEYIPRFERQMRIDTCADSAVSLAKLTLARLGSAWVTAPSKENYTPFNFSLLDTYNGTYRMQDITTAIWTLKNPNLLQREPSILKLIYDFNISQEDVVRARHQHDAARKTLSRFPDCSYSTENGKRSISWDVVRDYLQPGGVFDDHAVDYILDIIAAYFNVYFPSWVTWDSMDIHLIMHPDKNFYVGEPLLIKYGCTEDGCKTAIVPYARFMNGFLNRLQQFLIARTSRELNTKDSCDDLDRAITRLRVLMLEYDQILFPLFTAHDFHTPDMFRQVVDVAERDWREDFNGTHGHWQLIRVLRQQGTYAISFMDSLHDCVDSYVAMQKCGERTPLYAEFITKILMQESKYAWISQDNVPRQTASDCGLHCTLNIAACCMVGKKEILDKKDFNYDYKRAAGIRRFFAWHALVHRKCIMLGGWPPSRKTRSI